MKGLILIWVAVILTGAGAVAAFDYGTMPSKAYADASDKYDGDCLPSDTAGRCSDKCPDGQYLQGYDKDTGAAVCSNPPTGCPYAEQVPVGPQCDALAPADQQLAPGGDTTQMPAQPQQDVDMPPTGAGDFLGK